MKTNTTSHIAILLFAGSLLLSGCVVGRYSEVTRPDGTKTTSFAAGAAFRKDALKGLLVNSSSEKTKTGLKLQSGEGTPDAESINAFADLIGRSIGTGIRTAAGSGVGPGPLAPAH